MGTFLLATNPHLAALPWTHPSTIPFSSGKCLAKICNENSAESLKFNLFLQSNKTEAIQVHS